MCFSAGASFGAAAILGTAGVVTLTKTKDKSQLMFAAMPLLFGMQQLCEGFEWLSFNNPGFENFRSPMMYLFLIFAQMLWPSWVPISIWKMEQDIKRKKLLAIVSLFGLLGSGLLAYRLLFFTISSDIQGHHIHYSIDSPTWMIVVSSILYFVSTLVSPFSSSFKYMKLLGAIMLAALIITELFYTHYLISVWCFFASLLSIVILMVLKAAQSHHPTFHAILTKRINPDRIDW